MTLSRSADARCSPLSHGRAVHGERRVDGWRKCAYVRTMNIIIKPSLANLRLIAFAIVAFVAGVIAIGLIVR
jgi:hypothetical protein